MTPPTGNPGNPSGQPGQSGWTPAGPPPGYAGGTPYPPRSRPRLSGFPLFCLGCAGLAVLAFVLIAGFGYYQARKMMGPPITAATLSSAMPSGVPVYPRFTLVPSGSRHMKIPVPGAGRAAPQMTMLLFNCPDPLSTVGPWYQRTLAPQGWSGGPSPQNANQYLLKRGATSMVLQETQKGGQSVIMMMIARDPSRPGSAPVTPTAPGP